MNDFERKIIDSIAVHGWFGLSVSGEGEHAPPFTYSVGFETSLQCPEFIVFGLPGKLAHSMLWNVFRQIRDSGVWPREGLHWSGVLEDYDCISRSVHRTQMRSSYFNSVLWYRNHCGSKDTPPTAFQLFWPGIENGLFPWEPNCTQQVRKMQPLLYLPSDTGLA
jgi:hypothetical protein